MSAEQLPLALAQPHQNRQLFADRYLDVILPQRAAWLALCAEALVLERRLAGLVNAAYGLSDDDVALLWATAPPRMPGGAVRA